MISLNAIMKIPKERSYVGENRFCAVCHEKKFTEIVKRKRSGKQVSVKIKVCDNCRTYMKGAVALCHYLDSLRPWYLPIENEDRPSYLRRGQRKRRLRRNYG